VFDVAVVGAGPAGLFAVLEVIRCSPPAAEPRVVLIDQGPSMEARELSETAPSAPGRRREWVRTHGLGGAGMYSDGKLIMDLDAGGHLRELSARTQQRLLRSVLNVIAEFGGMAQESGHDREAAARFSSRCDAIGLTYKHYPVRHLGSQGVRQVIRNLAAHIEQSHRVNCMLGWRVDSINPVGRGFELVVRRSYDCCSGVGEEHAERTLLARRVVLAVGKEGAAGDDTIANRLGLKVDPDGNGICIGVRIEARSSTVAPLVVATKDPKISQMLPSGDKVKTHCFGHPGQVLMVRYHGQPLAGGQGVVEGGGDSSTFAVLVREGRHHQWSWGTCWALMTKVASLGDSLAVQSIGEFLGSSVPVREAPWERFASTLVPPGLHADVRGWLDELGIGGAIRDFLLSLEGLARGLLLPDHLVFFPAIEWWMPRIKVSRAMETSVRGLYAIGDGAGISQGIVQSAATGIIAGRAIARKLNQDGKVRSLSSDSAVIHDAAAITE